MVTMGNGVVSAIVMATTIFLGFLIIEIWNWSTSTSTTTTTTTS